MRLCRDCSVELTEDNVLRRRDRKGTNRPARICKLCDNKRRREKKRRDLGLPLDAPSLKGKRRNPPKGMTHGARTCLGCKQYLPEADFEKYKRYGTLVQRGQCRECRNEYRRELWKRSSTAERQVVNERRAQREKERREREREQYHCRECKTAVVSKRDGRCVACGQKALRLPAPTRERKETFREARGEDARRQISRAERQARAHPDEWTEIAPGQFVAHSGFCTRCNKNIVYGSRCYTHATGRPRKLFRYDERKSA